MTYHCNGICLKFKPAKKPSKGYYPTGHRKCKHCNIFMKYDGIWCPCCGKKCKTRPQNKRKAVLKRI